MSGRVGAHPPAALSLLSGSPQVMGLVAFRFTVGFMDRRGHLWVADEGSLPQLNLASCKKVTCEIEILYDVMQCNTLALR